MAFVPVSFTTVLVPVETLGQVFVRQSEQETTRSHMSTHSPAPREPLMNKQNFSSPRAARFNTSAQAGLESANDERPRDKQKNRPPLRPAGTLAETKIPTRKTQSDLSREDMSHSNNDTSNMMFARLDPSNTNTHPQIHTDRLAELDFEEINLEDTSIAGLQGRQRKSMFLDELMRDESPLREDEVEEQGEDENEDKDDDVPLTSAELHGSSAFSSYQTNPYRHNNDQRPHDQVQPGPFRLTSPSFSPDDGNHALPIRANSFDDILARIRINEEEAEDEEEVRELFVRATTPPGSGSGSSPRYERGAELREVPRAWRRDGDGDGDGGGFEMVDLEAGEGDTAERKRRKAKEKAVVKEEEERCWVM